LDSNEFLSKFLRHYVADTFLATHYIQKDWQQIPLFEVISFRGLTDPLENKAFLASRFFSIETFIMVLLKVL
jgi:hypothetical protein